jgi:transposase InsO family protein
LATRANERLATISVAHLYNLRRATGYLCARGAVPHKTRSVQRAIGERRAPQPEGRPGFIRVDSVHQGDLDGLKGVYLINAVDTVTQFQLIAAVERVSENYLLPVLRALLDRFPFTVRGFHADNGSEYINDQVAELLNKVNIELTKSRPRHSNDNALAEAKNGAIVRKHLATPTSPDASPRASMRSRSTCSAPTSTFTVASSSRAPASTPRDASGGSTAMRT